MTGDDLEIVQTAARYAVGLNYHPWVLRCLFEPLVFVWPAMKIAALAGARDPAVLAWAATIPTAAASTATIALVRSLALRWGWTSATSAAAAVLCAFHWLPFGYGATQFPRPISTAMLVAAFLLAGDREGKASRALAAGILTGAAFAVRWSEGVVLAPLLVWTAWRSRGFRRPALLAAGFGLGALLCVGMVDWATWGVPFSSLREFFRIMYFEMPASRLEHETPFYEYAWTVLHWAGPIAILLLFPAWRIRRAREPILIAGSIVLAMSVFTHKEWRYLQCAIPFLCLGAAAGWERLASTGHRRLAAAALVLSVGWGLERSWTLLSHKSQSAIAASRFLSGLRPRARRLAFEHTWAYGEWLYLGNSVEIREIEYRSPVRSRSLRETAADADVVGVYTTHLDADGTQELLRLGFRELGRFRKDLSPECVLFGASRLYPPRPPGEARQ